MNARLSPPGLASRVATPAALAAVVALLTVVAGSPAQAPDCSNRTEVPGGTEGNDTLTGTDADELFDAFGGDDTVQGAGGTDCIFGGAGDDDLDGGAGGDFLNGSSGVDTIDGGVDDDEIQGDDWNVMDGGGDTIVGGSGVELVEGHGGNDTISGGSGNDDLGGGQGRDKIDAGAGNDRVSTRDGYAETVRCGPGRDTLRADRRDRGIGCERIQRQPNPFPAMVNSTGNDRTTFQLRFESVTGIRYPIYYITIATPCGTIEDTTYGSYRGATIVRYKPQRFGKPGRWCTGSYKVRVEVQDVSYPQPNPPRPKFVFGRTSFKVRG